MSEYPLTLEELTTWLRSKEPITSKLGISLSELRQRQAFVPVVFADFEGVLSIGRISAWISGETDFEVLRKDNGTDILFRHEKVARIDEQVLETAFTDFLGAMKTGTPPRNEN